MRVSRGALGGDTHHQQRTIRGFRPPPEMLTFDHPPWPVIDRLNTRAAFLGQGKCVTRPSMTQWQQEETRPTTRTMCIYDTVTLTLTRPSHHARA